MIDPYREHVTHITIPNGVTEIGFDAFSGCTGLTSITIPNGVTSIGNDAFHGCTELKYIVMAERFKNQDADFFGSIGVDINRTAIYGMQDLIHNTDLQTEALNNYSKCINLPEYKFLTLLNPLSYVSIADLLKASHLQEGNEPLSLCLPGVAGLVNASKYNWQQLLRSLSSKVVGCADALAEWLSIYDIAKIQMAKVWKPRPQDTQVVLHEPARALQSEDLGNSTHRHTFSNRHRATPVPNPLGFSREETEPSVCVIC